MYQFNASMFNLIAWVVAAGALAAIVITIGAFAAATMGLANPHMMTLVFGHKRQEAVTWLAETAGKIPTLRDLRRSSYVTSPAPSRDAAYAYWRKASWKRALERDLNGVIA